MQKQDTPANNLLWLLLSAFVLWFLLLPDMVIFVIRLYGAQVAGIAVLAVLFILIIRFVIKPLHRFFGWLFTPKPKPPLVVPPPAQKTFAELAAEAKERHEKMLRTLEAAGMDDLELAAAKLQARQKYLKELDGLLQ